MFGIYFIQRKYQSIPKGFSSSFWKLEVFFFKELFSLLISIKFEESKFR